MRKNVLTCTAAVAGLVAVALAPTAATAKTGKTLSLSPLGTYASGVFGKSAAEITSFDPLTDRLFVVNALSGAVDVLDVTSPSAPSKVATLTVAGLAAGDGSVVPPGSSVNSVTVRNGRLAVAIQAPVKTDLGWAALYTTADLAPTGAVRVGALPDMVTFADDDTLLVANEAEPADDFSSDPEGSVSVVDLDGSLGPEDVRTARFTAYDHGAALPAGVRVFGPDVAVPAGQEAAGRVARNLEPEYVAVDRTGHTAYVTLQEANAIAVVDVRAAAVTDVRALPAKDWNAGANVLDASDRDSAITLKHWPVTGLLMPDTIASYEVDDQTYLVTANEGDAREWGSYVEPARVGSSGVPLCAAEFPNAATLKSNANLGRLNVTTASGFDATRGCYAQLFAFGGRSFSILDAAGGLVFDSGALFEQTVADLVAAGKLPASAFNATHDSSPSGDTRSDDKGVEPEGLAIGRVAQRTYAFVGLERIGGLMVFDITVPASPSFVQYVNNRDFGATYTSNGVGSQAAKDLGAEGVEFISSSESPTGRAMVAVANEVSGTTTLFSVDRL